MAVSARRYRDVYYVMSRGLDFIVFGVPRSGTKGLARALNLHPHVYCSRERFHYRTDHSRLVFPDSFLARAVPGSTSKIEQVRRDLTGRTEIRIAGNKLPRYYFALDRLNREVPVLRNIWIYRSPFGFMPSWNRREANAEGRQWPSGQVGLFGLLELIVCIQNCLDLPKDVFVFSYRHGLSRQPDSVLAALDFLGADPGLYDQTEFENRQQLRAAKSSDHVSIYQASLQAYEEELVEAVQIRELDDLMSKAPGFTVSAIAKELREYLKSISIELPRALDRAFSACPNSKVPNFAREYFNRHCAELTRFVSFARKSRSIGDFQTFGLYQRLRRLITSR
jgi:hypothetical protein